MNNILELFFNGYLDKSAVDNSSPEKQLNKKIKKGNSQNLYEDTTQGKVLKREVLNNIADKYINALHKEYPHMTNRADPKIKEILTKGINEPVSKGTTGGGYREDFSTVPPRIIKKLHKSKNINIKDFPLDYTGGLPTDDKYEWVTAHDYFGPDEDNPEYSKDVLDHYLKNYEEIDPKHFYYFINALNNLKDKDKGDYSKGLLKHLISNYKRYGDKQLLENSSEINEIIENISLEELNKLMSEYPKQFDKFTARLEKMKDKEGMDKGIFFKGYMHKNSEYNDSPGHISDYVNLEHIARKHMDDMGIQSRKDLDKILKEYPDTEEYDPRLALFLNNLGYAQLNELLTRRPADSIQKTSMDKEAVIKQEGNEWVLYSKDRTKILGRHSSKEKAEAQERAIQASKYGN